MPTATLERTVGQLVVERPSRARVFEKLGIDYCCGGKLALSQACAAKSLDVNEVLERLSAEEQSPETQSIDWSIAPLSALADHIQATHHAYLKQELPRLAFLTAKVAGRHGPHDPRLVQLNEVFQAFKVELENHMVKEEQILFPLIRQMDGGEISDGSQCGSIRNPIRVMIMEHDSAGHSMEQFESLTDGYTPPAGACNTYRALLDSLRQLQADMHQHVHKENHILFPRAVELESSL